MRLFQKTSSMLPHKREADKDPKNQISKDNSSHEMYACSVYFNLWFLYVSYEIWSSLLYFFNVGQEANNQITKKNRG